MCTANVGDIDDIADPIGNAARRNLSDEDANLIDPIGHSTDVAQRERQEQRDFYNSAPFGSRYAFTEATAEQEFQDYFTANQDQIIQDYYSQGGRTGVPEGGGIDELGVERFAREQHTARLNEIRTRSSRERARSTQVLSNVARRRAARTQQTLADTGASGGGRVLAGAPSGGRPGTLLSQPDEQRRSLLGGVL